MRKCLISMSLALLIGAAAPLRGEEPGPRRNISFGASTFAGYYGGRILRGEGAWRGDVGYGANLVFDVMFNNTLGVHTGLGYTRSAMEYRFYSSLYMKNVTSTVRSHTVSLPLCLITSFNTERFSFQILTGLTMSYVADMRLTTDDPAVINKSVDILYAVNPLNFAATAGFRFLFRVTRYADFFFSFTGDYYFTDFMKFGGDIVIHIYDGRASVGFLFRTDVFPMRHAP